jgi:cobalt/nickel transport system permease protein
MSAVTHPHHAHIHARPDDRAVLIATLVFVFTVVSVEKYNLAGAMLLCSFPVYYIVAARLGVRTIAKRILVLSPFILIMALANVFYDRETVVRIGALAISGGTLSASAILVKAIAAILAVMALSSRVPISRLCTALQRLRVPEVFVTQLLLVQRYSSVLVKEALAMQRARDIRSFGGRGRDLFTTAKLIGALLIRAIDRADRIYRAMAARGFDGRYRAAHAATMRLSDFVFIIINSTLIITVRIFT